ncbi:hypothetical protein N331_06426, partial [Merops nubicus]
RWTRGNAALLPRDVGTANGAHALESHDLRSSLLVVETLDPVVEVVHFHLLHFTLGRGLLAATGSWQMLWPAVVLGDTRPWDRGGLALERSSVTGLGSREDCRVER